MMLVEAARGNRKADSSEHRCRLVTLPYKDINECLMNGVTEDEIWQYIGTASYLILKNSTARESFTGTLSTLSTASSSICLIHRGNLWQINSSSVRPS